AMVGRVLHNYDRVLAREGTDRERFLAIGAAPESVEVGGNVKFDYEPDVAALEVAPALERLIAGRKTLVLGSTMEGEDEELLPEIERFVRERDAFVIIAPRKPERFEQVAGLLATTSLPFVRRTEMNADSRGSVLLLDTFGELAKIYGYATAAFIGGSIAPFGGHNPIEAAAAGVPVCFGPSMSNFREIAATFLGNGSAVEVKNPSEVIAFAERMLDDEVEQRRIGELARQTVLQNRGASEKTARRILELLP
ncbi:MAG TPA: glycosyltransferase, partial [Thermoanaerobaculia bacterium]